MRKTTGLLLILMGVLAISGQVQAQSYYGRYDRDCDRRGEYRDRYAAPRYSDNRYYSPSGYRSDSHYGYEYGQHRYRRDTHDAVIGLIGGAVGFIIGERVGESRGRTQARRDTKRVVYEEPYDIRQAEYQAALARERERNEAVRRLVRNEFEGVSVKVFADDDPEPLITLAPGVTSYIEVPRNARIWALAEVKDQHGNMRLRQDVGVEDLPNGTGKIFYNPHRDKS